MNIKPAKRFIKKVLNALPYVRKISRELDFYKSGSYVPPGHYYSPVVSVDEIRKREQQIYRNPDRIPGIDLNVAVQTDILNKFKPGYQEFIHQEYPGATSRYRVDNNYYSISDAVFLFLMMRTFGPHKIVEVGSGFSSAAMLDFNEFLESPVALTFIEPYPDHRLRKLVTPGDRYQLLETFLQDVEPGIFTALEKNDFLFIDSSHIVKTGSDVNYLFFEILPHLNPGVIIHLHDIFYPFEYPREWTMEKRSWNEDYFLRAFLMYNKEFEIIVFDSLLQQSHEAWLKANLPMCIQQPASGIWLRKK